MEGSMISLAGLTILFIGIILYAVWNIAYNHTQTTLISQISVYKTAATSLKTSAIILCSFGLLISILGYSMSKDAISFTLVTKVKTPIKHHSHIAK